MAQATPRNLSLGKAASHDALRTLATSLPANCDAKWRFNALAESGSSGVPFGHTVSQSFAAQRFGGRARLEAVELELLEGHQRFQALVLLGDVTGASVSCTTGCDL